MYLIDYARDVVGLSMGSLQAGRHIGWTTDRVKADAIREAGAHVITVRSAMIGAMSATDDPNRIVGYEASWLVGREYEEAVLA